MGWFWTFKRGLVLFFLYNFLRFFIFHVLLHKAWSIHQSYLTSFLFQRRQFRLFNFLNCLKNIPLKIAWKIVALFTKKYPSKFISRVNWMALFGCRELINIGEGFVAIARWMQEPCCLIGIWIWNGVGKDANTIPNMFQDCSHFSLENY